MLLTCGVAWRRRYNFLATRDRRQTVNRSRGRRRKSRKGGGGGGRRRRRKPLATRHDAAAFPSLREVEETWRFLSVPSLLLLSLPPSLVPNEPKSYFSSTERESDRHTTGLRITPRRQNERLKRLDFARCIAKTSLHQQRESAMFFDFGTLIAIILFVRRIC